MLKDLFFGRVAPWERHCGGSPEYASVLREIEACERYFAGTLSGEDFGKLERLRRLYTELAMQDECAAFCSGYAIGTTIMREVSDEIDALICNRRSSVF